MGNVAKSAKDTLSGVKNYVLGEEQDQKHHTRSYKYKSYKYEDLGEFHDRAIFKPLPTAMYQFENQVK